MTSPNLSSKNRPPALWKGQGLHALSLAFLLLLTWTAWTKSGSDFPILFWISIAIPVIHQVYVWLSWRLELNFSTISRLIGFQIYLILFFILFISRLLTLLALASDDTGSLGLSSDTRFIITAILSIFWIYTAYSVQRYFGFVRAAGADHFKREYRNQQLINKGIFRYTGNGMYVFGFFILWIVAVGFNSLTALIAAAFNHAYIWVHYYATEKPDMDYLYGSRRE